MAGEAGDRRHVGQPGVGIDSGHSHDPVGQHGSGGDGAYRQLRGLRQVRRGRGVGGALRGDGRQLRVLRPGHGTEPGTDYAEPSVYADSAGSGGCMVAQDEYDAALRLRRSVERVGPQHRKQRMGSAQLRDFLGGILPAAVAVALGPEWSGTASFSERWRFGGSLTCGPPKTDRSVCWRDSGRGWRGNSFPDSLDVSTA